MFYYLKILFCGNESVTDQRNTPHLKRLGFNHQKRTGIILFKDSYEPHCARFVLFFSRYSYLVCGFVHLSTSFVA